MIWQETAAFPGLDSAGGVVSRSDSRRKKETVADMRAPAVSHREEDQGEEKGTRGPGLVGRA